MKIKVIDEVNYFTEALIVASKFFTNDEKQEECIDYSKINISKNEFNEKYKEIIEYFESVRGEALSIIENYKDLAELFNNSGDNFPSISNMFIFSKLKNSINDYSKEELVKYVKGILISSINFNTNEKIDEEIDLLTLMEKLYIFDDKQKYHLLKLLNNTSNILDKFYEFIIEFEEMLRKKFYLIERIYSEFKKKLEYFDVYELKGLKDFKEQPIFKKIVESNIYLFINHSLQCSLSVFGEEEDKLTALVDIGFLPFLLKDYNLDMDEKKEDIQKKLSIISDSTRFNILYLLSKQKSFGKEIAEKLDISKGTVSYHLNSLADEQFVQVEIDGKKVFYSLNKRGFEEVVSFLKTMIGERDE